MCYGHVKWAVYNWMMKRAIHIITPLRHKDKYCTVTIDQLSQVLHFSLRSL